MKDQTPKFTVFLEFAKPLTQVQVDELRRLWREHGWESNLLIDNIDLEHRLAQIEALQNDIETVLEKVEAAKATISAMKRVLDSAVEGENT